MIALLVLSALVTLIAVHLCAVEMVRRARMARRLNEFRASVFQTEANLLRRREKRPGYAGRAVRGHKTRRTGRLEADPILRSHDGV